MASRNKKFKGPIFGPFFFKVDKPKGMTSFDVIRRFKRNLPKNIGKIGHFGTLDPFATGLLVIGIGPATRLNQYTQIDSKEYIATGVLGINSPTGDFDTQEGTIEELEFSEVSFDDVNKELKSFVGSYMQSPPAFSATKHEGKALHEWAREGVFIEKPPVERIIHEVELLEVQGRKVTFRVCVSSGTYIRVLFDDLAKKLGTRGALEDLRRTNSAGINLENSIDLSIFDDEDFSANDFLLNYTNPITELIGFEKLELDEASALRFINGQTLKMDLADGHYWIRSQNQTLGLAVANGGLIKSCVGFSPAALDKIDLTMCNSLDE
ncbi:tRNA pseudouridine(55) synthase [Bacteriovorax sp. BAL6_X]|uniref:tRNA pseudouridine(55) synthase TruB n=1 Tax=Bacteriovorax sp. BAL6_X TaxID=1201290 RepID=UPI000386E311|nr:tRNA pseudouridine(55) synthase TruB [Bacteriovorax sp. BAL6_X]EPZ50852.1 tRNA pseudouridine(55) synthase [Bacteriovorax sp. BAL6_X]